jgi:hypothetical protein
MRKTRLCSATMPQPASLSAAHAHAAIPNCVGVAIIAAAAWLCGCAAPGISDVSSEPVAVADEALIATNALLWNNHRVDVCFTNRNGSAEEQSFKDVLDDWWSSFADVDFIYGSCATLNASNTDHVEVTWEASPTWKNMWGWSGLGRPQSGHVNALHLSFCDSSLAGSDCTFGDQVMRGGALHEMGHALGVAHEHLNPARPSDLSTWCAAATPPVPNNEQWITNNGLAGQHFTNVCRGNGDGRPTCGNGVVCAQSPCGADGFCTACITDAGCTNGAVCKSPGVCGPPLCDRTVDVPSDQYFAVVDYDEASVMHYCRDSDGDHITDGKELLDGSSTRTPDWLSDLDILQARIQYGDRPYAQTLHDSAGFHTASGWITSGSGKLSPEYYADGGLKSAFITPQWWIDGVKQSTTTIEMSASVIPSGASRSVKVGYIDPWVRAISVTETVENSPSKFAALALTVL